MFLTEQVVNIIRNTRYAVLAKFTSTVTDNNVDNDRLFAEFFLVCFLSRFDEVFVQVFANQVDGATAEAAAHDA